MPILSRLARIDIPLLDDGRPLVRIPSRLALAVASPVLGLLWIGVLFPAVGRPYFFPGTLATLVPSMLIGARYGVLSATLFSVGFGYLYVEPIGSFAVAHAQLTWALLSSTVAHWLIAAICGTARGAHVELRRQHEALNEIHRQREDLLRALTHDVRSPLNAIGMSASLLAKSRDEAVPRRAETIQRAVGTIDSMLRDLVEIATLEAGAVRLEREPLELRATLAQLKEALDGSLPVERVEIAVPGDVPKLDADPRRFSRVLVNLVSNALKYSSGTVTIGAAAREDHVVVVSVRDEGAGIPADELPHVFEKFYRAKAARTAQGLGLGLYITRLLVEAHGGRVWAESALGKGTVFHVAMPAARPPVVRRWSFTPCPPSSRARAL